MIDQITPLVITFDEAPNIARLLSKLAWAHRIVVVDSGSTDATLDILGQHPRVDVYNRQFDSAAGQCNFGLDQIPTEWVLSLDADYVLSDELVAELSELDDEPEVSGYRAKFLYRIYGSKLRGALYPPRTVLHRTKAARYFDEGHTQRIAVPGIVRPLRGVIFHDDRKPLSRWFISQQRYCRLEAEHLLTTPVNRLSRSARIRRMAAPAPILVLLYVLFAKGCILDGWPGWLYALQRLLTETMIALELVDRRLCQLAAPPNRPIA